MGVSGQKGHTEVGTNSDIDVILRILLALNNNALHLTASRAPDTQSLGPVAARDSRRLMLFVGLSLVQALLLPARRANLAVSPLTYNPR